MSNDHNALEALIEDYKIAILASGDQDDIDWASNLISAAREERKRLVELLSEARKVLNEYRSSEYDDGNDCDSYNNDDVIEMCDKIDATLHPERKR